MRKNQISIYWLLMLFACGQSGGSGRAESKAEEKGYYVVVTEKDGREVYDTIFEDSFKKSYIIEKKREGDQIVNDTIYGDEVLAMMESEMEKARKSSISRNDSVYNEAGLLIKVNLGDLLYGATEARYQYNNAGLLINVTGYNEQNEVSAFIEDLAIRQLKYDDEGRLIEETHLDRNKEFVSGKYSFPPIINYRYDDSGQLVEMIYLEEHNGVRAIYKKTVLEYIDDETVVSTDYDTDGNEIEYKY